MSSITPEERSGLEALLRKALAERDRLNLLIEYASTELGVEAPSTNPNGEIKSPTAAVPRVDPSTGQIDPMSLVHEGELHGKGATGGAQEILRRSGRGRALKTDVLMQVLRKAGVPVKDYGRLYRALDRSPKFHRPGKGLWGLAEWYPDVIRSRSTSTRKTESAEGSETDGEDKERSEG